MPAAAFDPVAKNRIWKEFCDRETATIKLNTHFSVSDPSKLDVFPEKPNNMVPELSLDQAEMDEANDKLRELCTVRDAFKPPQEKYDLPMTSSQEIGWATRMLMPRNPMFHKPRNSCDITRYADAYYADKGVTPFTQVGPKFADPNLGL